MKMMAIKPDVAGMYAPLRGRFDEDDLASRGHRPLQEVIVDTPTDFLFTGQRYDSYINLYWFESRWYDSQLGRFISPDPDVPEAVQGVQAWDRYAYVNNSPVNYNDPSGHCLTLCTAIIGGAVGAIVGAVGYTAYTVATGKEFNTGHMFLAAGGGAAAGALIGTGVGVAAGMSTAAATTAAVTGAGAATTVLNATGGDPSDEISTATQAVQSAVPALETAANGVSQIPANVIRFTQDTISPNTRAGVPLDTLTQEIANGYFKGYIRVVEYANHLWSLDNRRLAAFKLLDESVPVKLLDISNPVVQAEFIRKFSTVTEGLSIIVKGTGLEIR